MATSNASTNVLKLYKQLHRTVQTVFRGDTRAQVISRDKIRSEFDKNKKVTSQQTIDELIKYGNDCDGVLRNQVIQATAVEGKENVYRATVTHGSLVDNAPYCDNVSEAEYKASVRAANKQNKKNGKTNCENMSNATKESPIN